MARRIAEEQESDPTRPPVLKIDRQNHKFQRLLTPSLSDALITERYDLQELIFNSPDDFFAELGQKLFLIGKEIEPTENVQDRIDLLAVDPEGNAVIIELKRGSHRLQLLQAISYAGMIAKWQPDDVLNQLDDNRAEQLADFLEVEKDDINRQQRIILIAEAFDYSVLVSAEWLSERYEVDIACCRIALATDPQSKAEFLFCSNVFPNPELTQQAAHRGRKVGRKGIVGKWPDWATALADVSNESVQAFYNSELLGKRENYLPRRVLRYRIGGKRRLWLAARRKNAYGWQSGRFEGDLEIWRAGLSDPKVVQEVKDGECLRFFLTTKQDFDYFLETVIKKLTTVAWSGHSPDVEPDDADEDE
jgi:hypothetical protein